MRYFILLLAMLAAIPAYAAGTLVIVGGGLSADNAEIYRAFIDETKGGNIAIIPSASGEPQTSLDSFAQDLVKYGVAPARIFAIRLAEIDDPATSTDEAAWANNHASADEIAKIERASGIWFTGGDQARSVRLLIAAGGDDSLMLAAIRRKLREGAVIGGTSAGAAIMGGGMIVCGDPKRAKDPVSRNIADCAPVEGGSEPLVLGRGLGFLRGHVVDQHFSERNRLPRLLRAQACGAGRGIGVDEDTAFVVDLTRHRARIIGKGTVTRILASPRRDGCAAELDTAGIWVGKAGQQFRIAK